MEILTGKINRDELSSLDSGYFDDMIKAVVDIEKEIIVIQTLKNFCLMRVHDKQIYGG